MEKMDTDMKTDETMKLLSDKEFLDQANPIEELLDEEEDAERLEISENLVKQRLFSARNTVKREVEKMDEKEYWEVGQVYEKHFPEYLWLYSLGIGWQNDTKAL